MRDFIKFLEDNSITANYFVDLYKNSKNLESDEKEILRVGLTFFKKSKSRVVHDNLNPTNSRLSEYIELWPKMVLPSGKPARANEKVLIRCFSWFFSMYDYDWKTVLEATSRYLFIQQDINYKTCRTNQYFIDKTNGGIRESVLADFCEIILNGEDNLKYNFQEKVV
jgi:hypothetical protein